MPARSPTASGSSTASGSGNRRVYEREDRMQWVTHEVWLPGRRAIAFVDWPRGMRLLDIETGTPNGSPVSPPGMRRRTPPVSAWCATPIFPIAGCTSCRGADGEAEFLCASEASSEGAHWAGPFPYNDGPVAVEARQHTHPHPRFLPDGARVVFTSDARGIRNSMKLNSAVRSHDRRRAASKASACASPSATAASPVQAEASRQASCSAMSRSCRRPMPSISCSTASATSAPARCSKCSIRATRCRGSSRVDADLRTDCARYSVFIDGVRREDRTDVRDLWRDDFVSFLIGSGITLR